MKSKQNLTGFSRRQFLKTTATAALATGLVKAGLSPTAARVLAQDQITLDLLTANWGGNYNELFTNIGTLFTEQNPDIVVEWEFVEDIHTTLLTRFAGGVAPDLALTYAVQANTLARLGTFESLNPYLEADNLDPADFVSALYQQGVYDGTLYALPGGADYFAMVYSKDIYREAGLDPEKPPVTLAEFMQYNEQILQKDANGNVTRLGYLPVSSHMPMWGYIFGGEWYDEENQKITANDPAIVEAFEWVYDYVKQMDYSQFATFSQRPGVFEPGNPFASGQLAHFIEGFWVYDALDSNSPDVDYGVMLLPTLTGAEVERENYMVGGWLFGIPIGTENADEAWQFMKFAFIDEAARMGVDTLNGPAYLPAIPAWEQGLIDTLGEDNRMSPYFTVFGQIAGYANRAWPAIPVSAYYTDELARAFDAVMIGEKTPQAALDEVTNNVQAELDAALAQQ